MIPIKQTQFVAKQTGDEKITGNCMAACIASILELPLESVPNFAAYEDWFKRLNTWLKDRNLFYIEFAFNAEDEWLTQNAGYHVMVGTSPRDSDHAVVGYQGKIVHDPHPSDAGLVKIDVVGFFIARLPQYVLPPLTTLSAAYVSPRPITDCIIEPGDTVNFISGNHFLGQPVSGPGMVGNPVFPSAANVTCPKCGGTKPTCCACK